MMRKLAGWLLSLVAASAAGQGLGPGPGLGISYIAPPPPANNPTSQVKFNPGYIYASYHVTPGNGLPSNSYLASDLSQLSSYPLPSNQLPAYAFAMRWQDLETFPGASTNPNASSQYSITALATVLNQIEAAFPSTGARVAIYLNYEAVIDQTPAQIQATNWSTTTGIVPKWVALANGTPSAFSVPLTFGSSSPVTTGVAAGISSNAYYNIIFANYYADGDSISRYHLQMPDWRSPQVQQSAIQMLQWLSQATFTITTGPFAGTWTLNTAPFVELIANNDEISWNFNAGGNQPNTPSGALSPTWQNIMSGYVNVMNATAALFPNTIVVSCTSYGVTGQTGAQNQNSDMAALVNPNFSFSSGGVVRYTSPVALSGSDTYVSDWGATISEANPAKQGQTGRNANGWSEGSALPSPTVAAVTGVRPYVAQVQPSDWDTNAKHIPSGVTIHTASMVTAEMQSAAVPQATHMVISNGDGTTFDREAWGGFGASSYIEAALVANYTTYPVTTTLPTSLMYGPTITSVTNVTTNSQTINWAAITGQGTGLSLLLIRNGTQIASVNPATVTSFNDSSLTPGTAYTYTLQMSNINGTGPVGPAMVSPTLVFNYPNFSGSPAVHATGNVALTGSIYAMTDGTSHHGGGLWYTTVQNIQAFTTAFTFQIYTYTGFGAFFVIQNSNSSTNPLNGYGVNSGCASANGMGYGGGGGSGQAAVANSIGIKFDAGVFNTNGPTNAYAGTPQSSTGLYVDGGPAIGGSPVPNTASVNGFGPENDLHLMNVAVGSDDIMQAVVSYDGTTLTMVLTDTVTAATTRLSWPVNIPAIVGANTAFVGFMSCSPQASAGVNTVNSWKYAVGAPTRLASPTLSVAAGQYTGTQTVAISGPIGASIYYTTNGLPPTSSSTLYTSPISVASTQNVQAVAISPGYLDSLVTQGYYQIQSSSTPFINFPSGFASNGGLIQTDGYSSLSSGNIVLTDNAGNSFECSAAWFVPQVSVSSFNTTFTLNMTSVTGPNSSTADGGGVAFVLQNYPQTTTGTNYNWGLGIGAYGTYAVSGGPFTLTGTTPTTPYWSAGTTGIFNSVAIVFDYNNGTGDSVGLYQNGVQPTGSSLDMTSSGVSLHAGHPLTVNIAYSGTTVALTVTDTVNAHVYSHSFTGVNIPTTLGASTGWAGFTGTTGYFGANTSISNWVY
jgi:chitobiase/beta-hexosaminidase-like protein/legume-like lectin family protein